MQAAPSDTTVKDVAEEWLEKKIDSKGYRPATLQNWKTHIDKYIDPSLGKLRIQQVGIAEVEKAAAEWKEMTSAYTANMALRTLTAVFKRAQRVGPLQGKPNAAQLAERVKVSNEEDTDEAVTKESVYTTEDLNKLLATTQPGSLERVLIMVPALLGLRIGEVLGLTWPAVDLKDGLLHVRNSLVDVGKANGGRELRSPKSRSSRRTLNLPAELVSELRRWKLACPPSNQGLVFCTLDGKPLHRKAASQILDEAITAAGIKRLTPHKLRHTFASLLLSRGARIKKVNQLLGHKDSVITLKVYEHFIDDEENDVQELASSILQN